MPYTIHEENLGMKVEHDASGWVVVANIEGKRTQFGPAHSSQKEAEFYAKHMSSATDRWTGAARVVEPDPIAYPGDLTPGQAD